MLKRMIYLVLLFIGAVILLSVIRPMLPDWIRIVLNSNPRELPEAIKMAKNTYKYDKGK